MAKDLLLRARRISKYLVLLHPSGGLPKSWLAWKDRSFKCNNCENQDFSVLFLDSIGLCWIRVIFEKLFWKSNSRREPNWHFRPLPRRKVLLRISLIFFTIIHLSLSLRHFFDWKKKFLGIILTNAYRIISSPASVSSELCAIRCIKSSLHSASSKRRNFNLKCKKKIIIIFEKKPVHHLSRLVFELIYLSGMYA